MNSRSYTLITNTYYIFFWYLAINCQAYFVHPFTTIIELAIYAITSFPYMCGT